MLVMTVHMKRHGVMYPILIYCWVRIAIVMLVAILLFIEAIIIFSTTAEVRRTGMLVRLRVHFRCLLFSDDCISCCLKPSFTIAD